MTKKQTLMTATALALFLLPPGTNAAPIQGLSPRTQFFLGTALRSFVRTARRSGGGNRLQLIQIPSIVNYNVATDVVATLVVPYVIKEFKTRDGRHLDARGVADIRLFGKYRFYRDDFPRGSKQMSVGFGLELPTGATNKRKDGVKLPPPLQLGSGGVDPFFNFAAGWITATHSLEGGVQFQYNTRWNGFRFGSVFNYDLSYSYSVYPGWPIPPAQLNFLLEFNGVHSEPNQNGKGVTKNSGRDTIFLSPGIQYIFLDYALVEASFQYPVTDTVNGNQLHEDYRVLFGVRIIF